jgi:hypothetical protein
VVKLSQYTGKEKGEDDGGDETANESLHGLLGRQLDQSCPTDGHSKDIGERVVANNAGTEESEAVGVSSKIWPSLIGESNVRGQDKPNKTLKDVVHKEG